MPAKYRRQGPRDMWGQMLRFRIPSTPLTRAHIWVAGSYSLIQGLGILLGGDLRWDATTYSVVRTAPGAPETWGWGAILLGVLILTGSLLRRWRMKAVGLLGLSGWSLAFSYGFTVAIWRESTAATTAGVAYAYICVSTAILVWIDEARAPRGGGRK